MKLYYRTVLTPLNDREIKLLISKDKEDFLPISHDLITKTYVENIYYWLFLKEMALTYNQCCGQIHLHGINTVLYYYNDEFNCNKDGNEENKIDFYKKLSNLFNHLVIERGHAQLLCTLAVSKDDDISKVFLKDFNKHLKKYRLKGKILDKKLNPNTHKILVTISFYDKNCVYNERLQYH